MPSTAGVQMAGVQRERWLFLDSQLSSDLGRKGVGVGGHRLYPLDVLKGD